MFWRRKPMRADSDFQFSVHFERQVHVPRTLVPRPRGDYPVRGYEMSVERGALEEVMAAFGVDQFTDDSRILWSVPQREAGFRCFANVLAKHKLKISKFSMLQERREPLMERAEWYLLDPRTQILDADEVPPGTHVRQMWPDVSTAFRRLVEDRKWTGVHFWWHDHDSSRFRCEPWYGVYSRSPMGRGVDHPWVDVRKIKGEEQVGRLLGGQFRRGVTRFRLSHVRSLSRIDDPLVRAVARLDGGKEVHVKTLPRFLRSSLPSTDFGYCWTSRDGKGLYRPRELYFRKHVFDELRASGLLQEEDVEPVVVLDAVPSGCEPLDELAIEPVAPTMTAAEHEANELKQAPRFEAWACTSRPARGNSVEGILHLIARNRASRSGRDRGERLDIPALTQVVESIGLKLPHSYCNIMQHMPGLLDDTEEDNRDRLCFMPNSGEYYLRDHYLNDSTVREMMGEWANALQFVWFGGDGSGDEYAMIVNDPRMPDDCPVVKYDHETARVSRWWEGVAAFFEEVMYPELLAEFEAGRWPPA